MSIKVMSRVWECSRHKGSELLLLLAIADFADDRGTNAYPSTETLAKKVRLSERSVQYLLRKLESSGELHTQLKGSRYKTNMYTINFQSQDANLAPPSDHTVDGAIASTSEVQATSPTVVKSPAPSKVQAASPNPLYNPSFNPPVNPSYTSAPEGACADKEYISASHKFKNEKHTPKTDFAQAAIEVGGSINPTKPTRKPFTTRYSSFNHEGTFDLARSNISGYLASKQGEVNAIDDILDAFPQTSAEELVKFLMFEKDLLKDNPKIMHVSFAFLKGDFGGWVDKGKPASVEQLQNEHIKTGKRGTENVRRSKTTGQGAGTAVAWADQSDI